MAGGAASVTPGSRVQLVPQPRVWSRTEKLLCLCSPGTLWNLHSDVIWDLAWGAQPGA